jgi:hypothetical protein
MAQNYIWCMNAVMNNIIYWKCIAVGSNMLLKHSFIPTEHLRCMDIMDSRKHNI